VGSLFYRRLHLHRSVLLLSSSRRCGSCGGVLERRSKTGCTGGCNDRDASWLLDSRRFMVNDMQTWSAQETDRSSSFARCTIFFRYFSEYFHCYGWQNCRQKLRGRQCHVAFASVNFACPFDRMHGRACRLNHFASGEEGSHEKPTPCWQRPELFL